MRDLLKRLQQLEAKAPESVYAVRWEGEAIRAKYRGTVIEREPGQECEAFINRAVESLNPDPGAMVWIETVTPMRESNGRSD